MSDLREGDEVRSTTRGVIVRISGDIAWVDQPDGTRRAIGLAALERVEGSGA